MPLADSDPRGTGLTAALFPLVLGGMLGGIAISLAIIGAMRRVIAVLVYSAVGGLAAGRHPAGLVRRRCRATTG